MGLTWIRRRLHFGRTCSARQCPRRRVDGLSRWCRDHTDAILAGEKLPRFRDPPDWHDKHVAAAAHRLGARRWLLLAEVALEREALHVDVLAGIVAQTDQERGFNRPCWTGIRDPGLSTPLDARADELLTLASPDASVAPERAREAV